MTPEYVNMREAIQIRLRETGNIFYYDTNNIRPKVGSYVFIVTHFWSDKGDTVLSANVVVMII